jgi:hypothetical protein
MPVSVGCRDSDWRGRLCAACRHGHFVSILVGGDSYQYDRIDHDNGKGITEDQNQPTVTANTRQLCNERVYCPSQRYEHDADAMLIFSRVFMALSLTLGLLSIGCVEWMVFGRQWQVLTVRRQQRRLLFLQAHCQVRARLPQADSPHQLWRHCAPFPVSPSVCSSPRVAVLTLPIVIRLCPRPCRVDWRRVTMYCCTPGSAIVGAICSICIEPEYR